MGVCFTQNISESEHFERSPRKSVKIGSYNKKTRDVFPEKPLAINNASLTMEFFNINEECYAKNRKDMFSIGGTGKNRALNRYGDVIPFDDTIVNLSSNKEYINASSMSVNGTSYISTQWPLNKDCNGVDTEQSFWSMIYENDINQILSLQTVGRSGHVAYYPEYPDRVKYTNKHGILNVDFNENDIFMEIECIVMKKKRMKKYVKKRKLPQEGKSKTVKITIYKMWPDKGVPRDMESFKKILERIDINRNPKRNSPILVHCSAGIGRSGVAILTHSILSKRDEGSIGDIEETLRSMRRQREQMVQNVKQYLFCYHFLWRYLGK